MSTSSTMPSTATVVELAGFRNLNKSSRHDRQAISHTPRHQACMLSMRQHLAYQASVEIDKFEWIKTEYGEATRTRVVKQVRVLLDKEFGKLRVHRYRRLFVIRHRSVEGLISSLLRVQFHAHQIELPAHNKAGEVVAAKPVTLTWGVGRTTIEAEVERLRRRRQKYRR